MSEAKHMDFVSGLETGVVGINEHQVGASKAFLMRLMGPRASDAADSGNQNVGGLHGGYGVCLLNELWCVQSVDVAQVSASCVSCPSVVGFEGQDAIVIVDGGLEF